MTAEARRVDEQLAALLGEDKRVTDGTFVIEPDTRWPHVYCNLGVNPETAHVLIEYIETDGAFRRLGLARTALRDICSWADEQRVTLELRAHRAATQPGPAMDDEELEAWYRRNGFEPEDREFEMMVRKPQALTGGS